jgi:DNA-binding MarR family transcriptional regulator
MTNGNPANTTTVIPWLDDGEQRAWRRFICGTRRLLDRLDADLREHGVNHDDYAVLVWLSEAESGRLRMSELADRAVVSRSRLSRHVGRLEQRGLVRRESCPEDRRGSFAVLTDEGRDLMAATAPHHVSGVREFFLDHLTSEELALIGEAFGRIDNALGPIAPGIDTDPDRAA